jgi:hypothetical protein
MNSDRKLVTIYWWHASVSWYNLLCSGTRHGYEEAKEIFQFPLARNHFFGYMQGAIGMITSAEGSIPLVPHLGQSCELHTSMSIFTRRNLLPCTHVAASER